MFSIQVEWDDMISVEQLKLYIYIRNHIIFIHFSLVNVVILFGINVRGG